MDHYSGVVVSVGSDRFDKLDQSAAGFWDAVLRPGCVVEVAHQNVVPMLHRGIHTTQSQGRYISVSFICMEIPILRFLLENNVLCKCHHNTFTD